MVQVITFTSEGENGPQWVSVWESSFVRTDWHCSPPVLVRHGGSQKVASWTSLFLKPPDPGHLGPLEVLDQSCASGWFRVLLSWGSTLGQVWSLVGLS